MNVSKKEEYILGEVYDGVCHLGQSFGVVTLNQMNKCTQAEREVGCGREGEETT